MPKPQIRTAFSRAVAYVVLLYGLLLIAGSLLHQARIHGRHEPTVLLISTPLIIGLGYVYLANLLLRLKYNAWLICLLLSLGTASLNEYELLNRVDDLPNGIAWLRVLVPLALSSMLLVSRRMFRVRSDVRSFTQAVRVSVVILLVAFLYGLGGFSLLDKRDFHHELSLATAAHQTIDQFGLTTKAVVPYSRRARLFVDSLSVTSTAAAAYVALSFFQPLRMRLGHPNRQRQIAERLLRDYPSDIDDFFKLWPHDKQYYFDDTATAGLAYHVTRGVALVAGNPFGDARRFEKLLAGFAELCFVNDWLPAFIHVDGQCMKLYKGLDCRFQQIGEEGTLNITTWPARQTGKSGKYFREIRNRFTKLGYSIDIMQPPHSPVVLRQLRKISDEWLEKPGRVERGFMLGYHDDAYFQQAPLAIVRDGAHHIQGFANMVPTYQPRTANYDLLRCSSTAPGNCNDFLLMGLFDYLHAGGIQTLNLGLSPLAGLGNTAGSNDKTMVDSALRFLYSNGDRLYSFSGLHRFKDKYKPDWQPRYIAYPGGIRNFTRILTALNRAMKIK